MNTKHGRWCMTTIALHWLFVPLFLVVLATGWWAEHRAGAGDQLALYEVHFSLGLVTLLLIVIRLVWRLLGTGPASRPIAARAVHGLIYLSTFIVILSGTVNFAFLGPVRVFGTFAVPRLLDPETQESIRSAAWYAHYYGYWLLSGLVLAHVSAALFHLFVRRDRVLQDFWFGRKL